MARLSIYNSKDTALKNACCEENILNKGDIYYVDLDCKCKEVGQVKEDKVKVSTKENKIANKKTK